MRGLGRNLKAYSVSAASGDSTGEGAEDGGLLLPDRMPSQDPVPVPAGTDPGQPDPNDPGSQAPEAPGDIDLPDKRSQLERVHAGVQNLDPDRAAQVLSIQKRIDAPADFIDKNLANIQKTMASPGSSLFKEIEDRYPGAAKWLSDPKNMAVAKDDLPNVAAQESLIQEATRLLYNPFKYGLEGSTLGLGIRQALPDEALAPKNPSVVQRFAEGMGGFAGDFPAMVAGGLAGTAAGATAGAVAGSPGGIPGIAIGVAGLGAAGGAAGAFALPGALRAALLQKIENGQITSWADVVKEAGKQGLVGLLTGGAGVAGKAVGGTAAGLAAEVATMTTAGKAVEGQTPQWSDIVDAALQVGALHGATHAVDTILQSNRTAAARNFYTALGDTAEASKLRSRMPEAQQELISQLTKDGPVENVYIPVDAAQSYFQSKGLDPAAVMADLGVLKSFEEAKATGGDVQIPLSTWASKLDAVHYQGLADDIKFSPDDLTAREVETRKSEIGQQVQKLIEGKRQEAAQQAQEQDRQAKVEQISKVREMIQQQLEAAGLSKPEQDFSPQLHEAFFNTLGNHMGIDPAELAERFPLTIARSETPEAAALPEERMAAQNQDQTFDQAPFLRLVEPPKPGEQHAETLERFIARFGGEKGKKAIEKAIRSAQDEGKPPYVKNEKIPGTKFSPNFESKATGTIGIDGFQEPHGPHPDPLSWYDLKFGATKALMERHAEEGLPLTINTSSDLVAHDDYIAAMPKDTTVRMHLMPRDPEVGRALFPGSPSLGRQEKAIEKLKEAGIKVEAIKPTADQIIESAGGIDKVVEKLGLSPEEARQKIGFSAGLRALFQGAPKVEEGPRGRIRIGGEGYAIDLFRNADRSTFLHETGHYFLDVMGHVAADDAAPAAVKEDYQTLLKWLGVGSREDIGTEEHEKFARGFEQYLMEGKAPSSALTRAFGRFRKWLVSIYQNAKNLHVEMSDDVRAVMNRMLASQDEIDRAQREAGIREDWMGDIPEELAQKIRDIQSQARDQAERTLLKQQMEETTAKHKEFLASERERAQEKAESDVADLPLFKAMDEASLDIGRYKRSGEGDDTVIHGERAGTVANKFLSGRLETSDMGKFEALAEIHGFGSGEELAHAMMTAEERGIRKQEIDARVEAAMAPHADLMSRDAIRSEAMKAIHNEKMTELLALEHQAMADLIHKSTIGEEATRRNRLEAQIEAQAAKAQARLLLAEKPVKEATNAGKYVTAERNAAVKAAKALAKKDYEAASEFKRQQMLNHAIAAEAMRNEKIAGNSIDFLKDFAKRRNDLKDMPYGFMRQIDQMLSKSGFAADRGEATDTLIQIAKDMTEKGEDPSEITNRTGMRQDGAGKWVPETLPDFIERVNDNYYSLQLPDSVMGSAARDPGEMTMGQLKELRDAVKAVADVGKKYERFLGEFKTTDIKAAAAELKAGIEEKYGQPFADETRSGSAYASRFQEKIAGLKTLGGFFTRWLDTMYTTCHKLDGLEEGPAKEYIFRPFERAADQKSARTAEAMKQVEKIFSDHYDPKELRAYKENRVAVGGRYYTKENILSMALNWGNEGNRGRLMKGNGLSAEQITKAFSDHLGKRDWDFVQKTWDHIDQYWPEISALEMEVNGVEPGRVQALEFQNEHGSYRGGYYPIAYDYQRSADAFKNAQTRDALYKQYSVAKAATEQGHAEARVQTVTRPLRLSLDVLTAHHEDVIHDLEFRRAVIDVSRFLNQRDVKTSLVNALGVKGYAGVLEWVKASAADGARQDPLNPWESAAQWLRLKNSVVSMGFKIGSAPKIFLENINNVASELGWTDSARAVASYLTGSDMHEKVVGKSEFMTQRAKHLDRDMADVMKNVQGEKGPLQWATQHAFFVHAYMDQAFSFPLWNFAYDKAIEEHGEEPRAVAQADEAVRRTFMSTGAVIDQPRIMRGSEYQKAMLVAYGYSSMMWNRFSLQAFEAQSQWIQGNRIAATAVTAKAFVHTFMIPALAVALTRALVHNAANESEEEKEKKMIADFLSDGTPLNLIPVARDVVSYGVKKIAGEHTTDLQLLPQEMAIQRLFTPIADVGMAVKSGQMSEKLPEHLANSLSFVAGVPKQINDVMFNLLDFTKDQGEFTYRDLLSRRTKK